MALSATTFVVPEKDKNLQHSVTPLLATISGRPSGSLLCIWRIPFNSTAVEESHGKKVKFAVDGVARNESFEMNCPPIPSPILYAEVKMENVRITSKPKVGINCECFDKDVMENFCKAISSE